MENALLVTDTKFSSRERSRVGKYNRPPSLPAFPPYFYAPSALLRKERTSLKLSPFLPFHVPSIRQTANLAAFLQPPFLRALFVRGHRWERGKSFSRRLGAKRPNPCRCIMAACSPLLYVLLGFYSFHFHNSRLWSGNSAYCVDSQAQVVDRIPLSKGCAHDGISNKERPPGLHKRPYSQGTLE